MISSTLIKQDYNPEKPVCHLLPVDTNNLYGNQLSKNLPMQNFKVVDAEKLAEIHWRVHQKYRKNGRLTINTWNGHHGRRIVHRLNEDWQTLKIHCSFNKKVKYKGTAKLMMMQFDKKKEYSVHFQIIKFYMECTSRKFIVAAWSIKRLSFKPYISFNSKQWAGAKFLLKKDFCKLLKNSLFGKTMENVRNGINLRLAPNPKRSEQLVSKPNHTNIIIFSENLTGHLLEKKEVTLGKPL